MLNKMSDLLYCHRFRFCARAGTMTNIPCRAFMGSSMSIMDDLLLSQKVRKMKRKREREKGGGKGREEGREKKKERDEGKTRWLRKDGKMHSRSLWDI